MYWTYFLNTCKLLNQQRIWRIVNLTPFCVFSDYSLLLYWVIYFYETEFYFIKSKLIFKFEHWFDIFTDLRNFSIHSKISARVWNLILNKHVVFNIYKLTVTSFMSEWSFLLFLHFLYIYKMCLLVFPDYSDFKWKIQSWNWRYWMTTKWLLLFILRMFYTSVVLHQDFDNHLTIHSNVCDCIVLFFSINTGYYSTT